MQTTRRQTRADTQDREPPGLGDRPRRDADVDRGPAGPRAVDRHRSTPRSTPGVTFIDTADAYHLHADEVGHGESLIAEALRVLRRRHLRRPGRDQGRPPAPRRRLVDARRLARVPQAGLRGVAQAARRRGDRPLPVPPAGPEGPVRGVGRRHPRPARRGQDPDGGRLERRTREQIRQAQEILGGRLVSVQNQFSPAFQSSRPELELCDQMGIAFLPWSPLGGISSAGDLGDRFAAVPARSPTRTASARSRSASRGCWRCRPWSSRSRGRAGRRPSATRCRRSTCS